MIEKFTPGPWCIKETTYGYADILSSETFHSGVDGKMHNVTVARVYRRKANARLMAAAPDMYYKIESALKEWDILPHDRPYRIEEITDWLVRFMGPAMEELRTALAKADGTP